MIRRPLLSLLVLTMVLGCGGGFRSFLERHSTQPSIAVVSAAIHTSWRHEEDLRMPFLPAAAALTTTMLEERLSSSMRVTPFSGTDAARRSVRHRVPERVIVPANEGGPAPIYGTADQEPRGEISGEEARALAAALHVDYVAVVVSGWRVAAGSRYNARQGVQAHTVLRLRIYAADGSVAYSANASEIANRSLRDNLGFSDIGHALPPPDQVTAEHWIEATNLALASALGQQP